MAQDSPIAVDGDAGFIGYSSRLNPITLPAGMLQLSQNMRLDRGVAVTRKGAKRLADDISPSNPPLVLDFILLPAPNEPIVRSSYDGGILAAAPYRSPDEVQDIEVVVLAGTDRAYTFLLDDSQNFTGGWADGLLVTDAGEEIITESGDPIVLSTLPSSLSFPSGPDETIEASDKVSMLQAFGRIYVLREADKSRAGWSEQYTNASGIAVSGAVATVNVTGHGYTAGMRVRIEGSATSAAFDGHEYDIATASTDTFTVAVPSGTTQDLSANITVRRVKPPLYWTGDPTTDFVRSTGGIPDVGISFRRMRSVGWGAYINNRMVIPDGKQTLMLSDILDPDTFDPFWQSFRVGVGGGDYIVAVHPWVDGTFLVFCRKSIWIAQVNQFASTDGTAAAIDTPISKLELLTDEIGCSARRTIQTAGQFIYFLSDSGVYRLDSRLDLKLRGETKPLSDAISDQVSDLNAALVDNAVGLYFNNRYYLAVPTAGATTSNNAVFIYNQLNEAWETKDIYAFGVNDFIVATVDEERRVLISNQGGYLMMLDEHDEGDDSIAPSVTIAKTPVAGRIRTRRYGFGAMSHKRFLRSLSDVVLPAGSSITVKAALINPDQELTLVPSQTNASGVTEDYTLKNPIRQRAHYCELEFQTNNNRPEIRNVSVEAATPTMAPSETRHAA